MITKTKRQMVSRAVKIPRKVHFWGVSPTPGKHNAADSLPMLTALRDYLKLGDKEREITRILNNKLVKVDGKTVKERRYPIGFMDVVSVDGHEHDYRVLYDSKGRLTLTQDMKGNSGTKLAKVEDKKTTKGGKIQLVLHDGQNIITEDKSIKSGDVLVLKLPGKEILQILKFQVGNKAFLTGGSHVGKVATVKKIEIKESSHANMIHFEEGFSTVTDYVFIIGTPKFTFEFNEVAL
ncbi:MAG: 30S ribosomal protein S4e [Thermoplasmataceae archaeon]